MAAATTDQEKRVLMCPENVHEGMRLGPIFYVVTAEQIDRFARATSNDNPLFTRDRIALPTMRLQDYALLIAKHFYGGSGGVHAKHWNEFHAPMRAGRTIKSEGRITKTERKRGKFYFELEYESRDAETGELLMRQAITSVLLVEGKIT
ncbi:MAG TPA: MaoC family dehydratase N-terminal domain-containing protein [Candidatus Binataceae bacterium]|nr:MaoC family dehydratase N-terminal domain-containing protein [Candidatus Binataceae bacterium]